MTSIQSGGVVYNVSDIVWNEFVAKYGFTGERYPGELAAWLRANAVSFGSPASGGWTFQPTVPIDYYPPIGGGVSPVVEPKPIVPITPIPDLVTIGALDDRRPEWEAAYQNKQMTYAQYLAIFNAYIAIRSDLSNRSKYDAYLAALGAPRTPADGAQEEQNNNAPCFFAYIGKTIKPVNSALPAIRRFRDKCLTGAFASLTLQYYEFSGWIVPWIGSKRVIHQNKD